MKYLFCGFLTLLCASAMQMMFLIYYIQFRGFLSHSAWLVALPVLYSVSFGFSSYVSGVLSDKYGAARVLVAGSFLSASALFALPSCTDSLWFLLVAGVWLAAAQASATYVPLFVLTGQSLPRQRAGLSYALMVSAMGGGYIAFVQLWEKLEKTLSWQSAAYFCGLLFCILGCFLCYMLRAQLARVADTAMRSRPLKQAFFNTQIVTFIRTRAFLVLASAMLCTGLILSFHDSLLIHFIRETEAGNNSYLFVICLGVVEMVSVCLFGVLSKYISPFFLLGVFFILKLITMTSGFYVPAELNFTIMMIFYAAFLSCIVLSACICFRFPADFSCMGAVFGLLFCIHELGRSAMPVFDYIFDFQNSIGFLVYMVVVCSAPLLIALLCFITRLPRETKPG
ncbi:MFS transporter [Acetobacter sp. DsW_059]|uniref:MFS transporter n=1 Tax=Acetobacter sp. DsW_059 TaxID=1670661 RepID=UPI000A395027|nr:MFS transporter [Acetobacter sp. DsW_059]OUJ10251.1 hypothetical protein HK25_07635 [Acetobacter sp. DsW_059]